LGDRAGKDDPVAQTKPATQLAQVLFMWSPAYQQQPRLRVDDLGVAPQGNWRVVYFGQRWLEPCSLLNQARPSAYLLVEEIMRDLRVPTGDVELQIREYEHDGDPVLLLHFGGANLMAFEAAVPFFQGQYRLILVDLRGHGKSDKPETGYHIVDMARDLVGLLDQLGLERAHVVGSSLGAEVGLSMAANHPQRVASLICEGALYSEFGPYGAWEGTEAEYREYVAERLEQLRTTAAPVYPSIETLVEESRENFAARGWWNEHVEAMKRYDALHVDEGEYSNSFPKQAGVEYMTHYYGYHFEDYYQRVECPLLMISDEEDLENAGYA